LVEPTLMSAGAESDGSTDPVVDYVCGLLGQHVSGVGNVDVLCAVDACGQVGGVRGWG
jgi:hypothetical protein